MTTTKLTNQLIKRKASRRVVLVFPSTITKSSSSSFNIKKTNIKLSSTTPVKYNYNSNNKFIYNVDKKYNKKNRYVSTSPSSSTSSSSSSSTSASYSNTKNNNNNNIRFKRFSNYYFVRGYHFKPPAPHNTTSMLMDAHSHSLKDTEYNEIENDFYDFNFSGSFLPSLSNEDFEEYLCNSSIDV